MMPTSSLSLLSSRSLGSQFQGWSLAGWCLASLIGGTAAIDGTSATALGGEPVVRFDIAAVAAAKPVAWEAPAVEVATEQVSELASSLGAEEGDQRWSIPLELSTLITDPTAPRIDQMLVEVDLQDPRLWIDDFSPRTQLSSPYAGDIAIEQTEEANKHLGFNAAGTYAPLHGDIGGDAGQKQTESRKFLRTAPLEILAASGTTRRGRGVFFKLRATSTQVLEGDKAFEVVVRAPADWRGGLVRVHASAQVVRRSLPGMPLETVAVGDQTFLVAAHRMGDTGARRLALRVIEAERQLRVVAREHERTIRQRSAPTLFHQFVNKLDLAEPRISPDWLQTTIFGNVDAHHSLEMRRLPVDVRIAVLDYQDARSQFVSALSVAAGAHLVTTEPSSR